MKGPTATGLTLLNDNAYASFSPGGLYWLPSARTQSSGVVLEWQPLQGQDANTPITLLGHEDDNVLYLKGTPLTTNTFYWSVAK